MHIRMRARTREHIHERTVQPVPGDRWGSVLETYGHIICRALLWIHTALLHIPGSFANVCTNSREGITACARGQVGTCRGNLPTQNM